MTDFVHLHNHTTYSFLDGYGTPKQFLDRVEEIGHTAVSITDHGNIWSHIPFHNAAKDRDIKVIPGIEFYIVEDAQEKVRKYFHITVLAKNQTGLENIHRLVTYSNMEGFYYKPRIDFNSLLHHSEGLIVLSGCMGAGVLLNILEDSRYADKYLTTFKRQFTNDFYIEVSPQHRVQAEINKIIDLAEGYDIPWVSTSDTHFPRAEDHDAEDLMLCIGMNKQHSDPDRMVIMPELYMFDGDEAERRGKEVYGDKWEDGFDRTLEIADKVNIQRVKSQQKTFPVPYPYDSGEELFVYYINRGVKNRDLRAKPNWELYRVRLDYELGLIKEKNYIDYFLFIHDMVQWAKQRMLVGPARGSVAGSLVAYVLFITEVDPLEFDLLFERFIDVTRYDPPDIDIDFPDDKRQIVIDYMIEKYGEEYTSLIGTLSYFKPKVAIWDTRRVYDLPWSAAKDLTELILTRSSGDARAALRLKDTFEKGSDWYIERAGEIIKENPLFKRSSELEGQLRQTGVHAAAVVVSEEPLIKLSGFQKGKQNERILCVDKYGAESIGLLKIDILGLKQLTIFEKILEMIGKDSEWLYKLPKEDERALKIFRDNKCWGIFQYEGEHVQMVNKAVMPDSFINVAEISALARPGALHCGGTAKYMDFRGYEKNFDRPTKKKPEYLHPLLKEMAGDTYGIVIYQEQVMRILVEIGHMGWQVTSELRKAMSKSYGVEFFNKYKIKFVEGATTKSNIEESVAELLWENLVTFGSWAFNKSHAVSYGLISYWCAYLKAHYPDEFYVCTLQKENDDEVAKKILREWVNAGGKFFILDADVSEKNFTIKDGVIYGGYSNLKGIGDRQADKIIGSKPYKSADGLRKHVTKKVLSVLKTAGSLKPLPIGDANQINIFQDDEYFGIDDFDDIGVLDINDIAPWADLYPIGDEYNDFVEKHDLKVTQIEDVDETTKSVTMIVKMIHINLRSMKETSVTQQRKGKLKDKHLDKFLNVYGEDDTGNIIFGVSRFDYPKFGPMLFEAGVNSIIAVFGMKVRGYRKISVKRLKVLRSANVS